MQNISIDLGTYSIKFLRYKNEKKATSFTAVHEIIIDQEQIDITDTSALWAYQANEVQKYLSSLNTDFDVFMNLPSDIVSMRYLTLPVKNKKKATLMLPFQIEEDLPYSIAECHYSETFQQKENTTSAQVGLTRREHFNEFYKHLMLNKLTPKCLTSDASSFSSYIRQNKEILPEHFCVIDLGHTSTKAYYFADGELVANHNSYIAGRNITDKISKTYNISQEESTLYKHKNSFLLTQEQLSDVDENQRSFAKVMDEILSPLISEIKRWDIGHRVHHGIPVSEIFLIGGTSNIKNIHNYIEHELEVKVSDFDFFKGRASGSLIPDKNHSRQYALSSVMAQASFKKSAIINFLRGDYAIQSNSEFPINSYTFAASRVAVLTMIICISLFIEGLVVSSQITSADKGIKLVLKNQTLELSGRDRRSADKNPKTVLAKLSRKEKNIKQIISTIQSSLQPNALINLNKLVGKLSGYNVELIEFSSKSGGEFNAVFKAKEISELKKLESEIRQNKSLAWFSEVAQDEKILTIRGEER